MIMGGCMKCGRTSTLCDTKGNFTYPSHCLKDNKVICITCYEEYYSPESIRNLKINKILKNPWYRRLFKSWNFFN